MTNRRCRAGVAVYNGQIWAIGGFNGNLRVRTVDVYDPTKSEWNLGPPMDARRSTLGAAVLNGKLYAVGGFDGSTGLDTAEVYQEKVFKSDAASCIHLDANPWMHNLELKFSEEMLGENLQYDNQT